MRGLILLFMCACSGGSGGSAQRVGGVFFSNMGSGWSVSAAFYDALGSPYASCQHKVGACTVTDYSCVQTKMPVASPTPISAGVITVEGGGAMATLTPKADGSYDPQNGAGMAFADGTVVTATAEGAAVPAFTGSVTMPSPASIAALPAMVPRDQDLTVSWSGGSDGDYVSVILTAPVMIVCNFDAPAESGQVSSSLLQLISAGASVHWLGVGVFKETQVAPEVIVLGQAPASGSGTFTTQ